MFMMCFMSDLQVGFPLQILGDSEPGLETEQGPQQQRQHRLQGHRHGAARLPTAQCQCKVL